MTVAGNGASGNGAGVASPGGRLRVVFGAGTDPRAFDPDGAQSCIRPDDLHAIASGPMLVGTETVSPGHGAVDVTIAPSGGEWLIVRVSPDQTSLMAGRSAVHAFRNDETPAQVAKGLIGHARAHAMTGAVILNRVPGVAFAKGLRRALAGLRHDLRMIVVDRPLPAGKPGGGPENHVFLTPDAPGRNRMTAPDPDPWRAPPDDTILPEAAMWRCLARDVADILPARVPGLATAFDPCLTATEGVILLVGRRIRPWRVRPGTEGSVRDQVCRPFDRRRGIARRGAAPGNAVLDKVRLPTRLSHPKPDAGAAVPFLRAMAIRVPVHSTSELIAKSAQMEDPALLALARDGNDGTVALLDALAARRLAQHRPKGLRPDLWDQVRRLNGSGRRMPREAFRNGRRSTVDTCGYDRVQLNDYAVPSAESVLAKRDRRRVNRVDRDQGLTYRLQMNRDVDADRPIMRLGAKFHRLRADPAIAAAHDTGVARHRDRVPTLRGDAVPDAFHANLTSARMERPCRMQPHFGLMVFAAGPGAVPDDLLDRDLPEGFRFGVEILAGDAA